MESRLDEYIHYLKSLHHIPSDKIKYYIMWTERYLTFLKAGEHSTQALQKFLSFLEQSHPDWQVKQAAEAINLFLISEKKALPEKTDVPISTWEYMEKTLREKMLLMRRARQTIESYCFWLNRFKLYIKKEADKVDIDDYEHFITNLAVVEMVSQSTQNQAYHALLFLFRYVLHMDTTKMNMPVRSHIPPKLPVVLTIEEIKQIFSLMKDNYRFMGRLIYGSGLRLNECLSLRIKDMDLIKNVIHLHGAKGNKERFTVLPESLNFDLKEAIAEAEKLYKEDRLYDKPGVWLPDRIHKKYPNACKEWNWFWLFPSSRVIIDDNFQRPCRFHQHPSGLQRDFHRALKESGITKKATVHTLRHSFATHLVEAGYDIRTIQELLGHNDVNTTMIYTHVAQRRSLSVISPIDK